MDRFSRLSNYLEDVLANPDADLKTLQTLQLELERARPAFLSLLDTPPKNDAERNQLKKERGSFTYLGDGTTYTIGAPLMNEVLFLSDTLNASEQYCASLIIFAIQSAPTASGGKAEAGLYAFLSERASLLRCLHAVWRGALSADPRLDDFGIQQIFERETHELTQGGRNPATGNSKGSWIDKVLDSLERTKALADSLRTQLSQPQASSALVVTNAQHGASFSDETTERRIQAHEEERNALSQLLFLLAAARQLPAQAILTITRQLMRLPATDGSLVYLLTALFAALDSTDPAAQADLHPLFVDTKFVKDMDALVDADSWAVPALAASVQLQWSVFLEAAEEVVQDYESDRPKRIAALTWKAIDGGAFAFLGRSVLAFKRDAEHHEVWGGVGAGAPELGGEVEGWFQDYVTDQIELLAVAIVTTRTSALRKLRNRDEDTTSPTSHRGGGRRHSLTRQEQPRHDLEALFLLIATIYRGQPDSGLKFWEEAESEMEEFAQANLTPRLAAFLRWGSECRPPGMMRAYYEMVASLASGPRSATYAFEFLSANGGNGNEPNGHVAASSSTSTVAPPAPSLSWSALFGALEFYHLNLPDRPLDAGPNAEGVLGEMPPEEVPLLRSFVRLLRQVVAYSDIARATLYDNQRHRPIATLFALLGRPIPIELKASLLSAIAAFARPGGAFGTDVARRTWVALEQSQILPTLAAVDGCDPRGGAGLGASMGGPGATFRTPRPLAREGGIFTELEEVETPNKVYPESTAFVALLNTLVHTPPAVLAPLRQGIEAETNTVPENLGSPHRAPGVDPYVRFVIDDVLLKTGVREFADPRERWGVTSTCLAFVEKCLASFDLGPFLAAAGGQRVGGTAGILSHLVLHPGFDILLRILSGSELLESILTIVTAGYDAIAQNLAGTPLFIQCVLRCLRILHRTMELQAPFLEVVLPSLSSSRIQVPQDKSQRIKNVAPVDQALLYNSDAVVQIALCVGCAEDDEIALLAVKILGSIAVSPLFDVVQNFPDSGARGTKLNRLVGILDASADTLRVLDAFMLRLGADIPESDLDNGEWQGPDSISGGSIRQAIRSAILDVLLQGTQPGSAAPNFAHLVLGFDVRARPADLEVASPEGEDAQRTSLHVILSLLGSNAGGKDAPVPLLERHPVFAAKCYRLVRQLCLHSHTSGAISRYLRTRERFFLRQTHALPFRIPASSQGSLGSVVSSDGMNVVTSSATVSAVLQSQAWLLESTALELNVLATGNDTQRELELVNALFGTQSNFDADQDDEAGDSFDQGSLQQRLPRMLEIFHAFDFSWHDAIAPSDRALSLFGKLGFDSCLRQEATGCEVYDMGALLSLISAARRELQNRGVLNTREQQEEAKRETLTIVETLMVENHRRQIQFARFHALRAWRNLLDVTLAKAFHLLPLDGRHSLLLDLLSSILPPIAASETDRAISELLSGAAVLLMTRLRDEGVRNHLSDARESFPSVSPERLHSIFRAILHAILQPGVPAVVRGNLYAVFLNYVQYSTKIASTSSATGVSAGAGESGAALDDSMSLDGATTVGGSKKVSRRNALEAGNLAILQAALERLLPTLCRDAAVGHEVWRTVAFTALDTLIMMVEEGRVMSKALAILTKQGYLQNFITSLKDAEPELLATLETDPESLNALYIYEAQMSFLIRVASSREGAEKLLNADLLIKLAQCDYLGARPHVESSSMEFDGFLPPATERHHQLLLPALQLVVGTLVSFGADKPVATKQASELDSAHFLGGQRENLVIALRNAATTPTLASLQEAQLIVTLLGIVLPSVSDEDLTTLSSYGGLHTALLGLSAKLCGPQAWIAKVSPTNDSEREEAQTGVLALRDPGSLFSEKVEALAESLEVALLTYHSIATRKRGDTNAFRPVWLPSLTLENQSAPTLGSSIVFLRDASLALSDRLKDVTALSLKLEHFEATAVDELEESLGMPEEENLTAADRRDRVHAELASLLIKNQHRVTSSLHLIEIALLLFWRHVAFFTDPEKSDRDVAGSRPDFGLGLAESLRSRGQLSTAPVDVPALRTGIATRFLPVAEGLESLELTQKTVGPSFRARESYIHTVLRRLHEVVLFNA